MRERELEVEIARLNAEIESLRGDSEPTDVAARFLAMAASTFDRAMEEARREADEFAAEVSAEAEARRDEATRIAEEAKMRADRLRDRAEQSESVVRQAEQDAEEIRAAAEHEASELVTSERVRLADELEVLSGVRAALEEERGALESYHEELQRRVQELAESMVSFMTTEPPLGSAAALDDSTMAELATVDNELAEAEFVADDPDERDETDEPVETAADEQAAEIAFVDYVIEPAPADEAAPADEVDEAPEVPELPDPAPSPPTFHDMLSAPTPEEFDGVPVVDDPAEVGEPTGRGGLFGRATDDEQEESAGLFGARGARLIEQTSPQELAAALADEDAEDERFRSFLDGDDDTDPSRDWLLRPGQH